MTYSYWFVDGPRKGEEITSDEENLVVELPDGEYRFSGHAHATGSVVPEGPFMNAKVRMLQWHARDED